ncbi:MAG: alanine racemase [Candidatus Dadabacteria bacterium]|nr:alanine racemase [Candidatus Dadabacteria bacterium]
MRPTWAEISLDSFKSNLGKVKMLVGRGVCVMAVVKADAYGHGAVRLSKTALSSGADMLGVATVPEALQLRKSGITGEIFLLGGIDPSEAEIVVENGFIPACYSSAVLKALSEAASKSTKTASYHLKVDTGMTRLGVSSDEASSFASSASFPAISLEGVFTHLASSNIPRSDYTDYQLGVFRKTLSSLQARGIKYGSAHCANSAAVQKFPDSHMDIVRPGIMLYGLEAMGQVNLKPVMKLKTRIVQLRKIREGTSVGYGESFVTQRQTWVATLPIGYADGYPRALSNRAKVSLGGKLAPLIGSVCMDFIMVDVTDIPGVRVGDEVVLFGDSLVSVADVSSWAGTISYEILSRISPRVPRHYI